MVVLKSLMEQNLSESVASKCNCGRQAVAKKYRGDYGPPACFICQLVWLYTSAPPRSAPGNISDWEIKSWMEEKLRAAFEDMLSMMRADLDTLSKKWNSPVEQSDKPK